MSVFLSNKAMETGKSKRYQQNANTAPRIRLGPKKAGDPIDKVPALKDPSSKQYRR